MVRLQCSSIWSEESKESKGSSGRDAEKARGNDKDRRAKSKKERSCEEEKQCSSESSSSSTGGTDSKKSRSSHRQENREKRESKKNEGRAEKSGLHKKDRSKRGSRSPRSRKESATKGKKEAKRQGRSREDSGGEEGDEHQPAPVSSVVLRSSLSPRRLSDPEISPRKKPEKVGKRRHQRRSSGSSEGERPNARSDRTERKERARAERVPKAIRVRRMASYNDSLTSGSSDDEDEREHRSSPFMGRKTRRGGRKHSRSMSSENLLQEGWDDPAEPHREGTPPSMDPLVHKRISDQARQRRKNSRATQLNHSDLADALSSSLSAKVKEEKPPNRRLLSGTSLARIHKHKHLTMAADVEASEAFEKALVGDDWDLLVAVCRSEPELAYGGTPELLRHILDLLAYEDQLEDFVGWFLRNELEETASSSLVFRGVSIASVLFASHFFLEADAYLRETVLPLVTHVCSIGRSWEVNPAAADGDTDVKENTARISTLFEGFLDKIFGKNHRLPASISRLFLRTRELISTRFVDEQIDSGRMLIGFFFLRFLCPVIIAPDRFGLATASPDSKARRGLVIISKLLQNLANGTEFDYSKEVYMCEFNHVLSKYRTDLSRFAEELVSCTETPHATPDRLSPALRNRAVQFIFAHVQTSFASVRPLCSDATKAMLDKEFPELARQLDITSKPSVSRSSMEEVRPSTPTGEPKKSKKAKKKATDPEHAPAIQTQESSEEADVASHLSVLKELLRGETQSRFAAEEQLRESQVRIKELQAATATLCELVERLGGSIPEAILSLAVPHA